MAKVRVHQLAKELGIEPKDLIARSEKLGVHGKRAQSSLETVEVDSIRSAFAAAEKRQVQVGLEKVTSDRQLRWQRANQRQFGYEAGHIPVVGMAAR